MTDAQAKLLTVLTSHFGAIETPESDVMDAQFLRDLRPDSLDVVEVLMDLEDAFHIVITDDEAMQLNEKITLREILALVEAKVAGKDEVANA